MAAGMTSSGSSSPTKQLNFNMKTFSRELLSTFELTFLDYFGDTTVIGFQFHFEFHNILIESSHIFSHRIDHAVGQLNFLFCQSKKEISDDINNCVFKENIHQFFFFGTL